MVKIAREALKLALLSFSLCSCGQSIGDVKQDVGVACLNSMPTKEAVTSIALSNGLLSFTESDTQDQLQKSVREQLVGDYKIITTIKEFRGWWLNPEKSAQMIFIETENHRYHRQTNEASSAGVVTSSSVCSITGMVHKAFVMDLIAKTDSYITTVKIDSDKHRIMVGRVLPHSVGTILTDVTEAAAKQNVLAPFAQTRSFAPSPETNDPANAVKPGEWLQLRSTVADPTYVQIGASQVRFQ